MMVRAFDVEELHSPVLAGTDVGFAERGGGEQHRRLLVLDKAPTKLARACLSVHDESLSNIRT